MDFDLDFDNGDDVNGDGDSAHRNGADVDSDDDEMIRITESQDSDGFTTDDATGKKPLLYSFVFFPLVIVCP